MQTDKRQKLLKEIKSLDASFTKKIKKGSILTPIQDRDYKALFFVLKKTKDYLVGTMLTKNSKGGVSIYQTEISRRTVSEVYMFSDKSEWNRIVSKLHIK